MISAVHSIPIDLIILISSIKDEYEISFDKGTVKEDILLTRSVGCDRLLVLWNKCDIVKAITEMKEVLYKWCKS